MQLALTQRTTILLNIFVQIKNIMTLKEFKSHIESYPNNHVFNYGISEPFSWRGVYAEVAFDLVEGSMSKEDVLANIQLAYDETFTGYKGGEYRYDDHTDVHFEEDISEYTDGNYTAKWISKIEFKEPLKDNEIRLVKLAFN